MLTRATPKLRLVPARWFTGRQSNIKIDRKLNPRFYPRFFNDVLELPEAMDKKFYIEEMMVVMKRENALAVGQSSLARAAYNCARHDIKDDYLMDLVSESLMVYKGKIKARESFGLFYASLRLNYSKEMIYFSKGEFERHLTQSEAIRDVTRNERHRFDH